MPEGDTIHRIAVNLGPRLIGKVLERVTTQGLARQIAGTRVTAVGAVGKHLVIDVDSGAYLRMHLGMYGRQRSYPRREGEIYAQVVDDVSGATVAHATSLGREKPGEGGKIAVATQVGEAVAAVCIEKGIKQVVFDRNGYIYHGRVKALADGARKGGLSF